MTLAELMIVCAMLAILAAILVPMFGSTSDMARTEAMASNAAQIRGLIIHHAGTADVPLSLQGFPQSIDGTWFKMGRLPDHAWTSAALIVETVSAGPNVIYPASKTFDAGDAAATNAWYNTSNGRFCVRVPAQTTDAGSLHLFNDVNKINVRALGQTTE
jgi:type II secretory pathway pseudopilin PulG